MCRTVTQMSLTFLIWILKVFAWILKNPPPRTATGHIFMISKSFFRHLREYLRKYINRFSLFYLTCQTFKYYSMEQKSKGIRMPHLKAKTMLCNLAFFKEPKAFTPLQIAIFKSKAQKHENVTHAILFYFLKSFSKELSPKKLNHHLNQHEEIVMLL